MANEKQPQTIEAIVCKCGATYAASVNPNDLDWLKQKIKAHKKGQNVVAFPLQTFKLRQCTCKIGKIRGHTGTEFRDKLYDGVITIALK